MYTELAGRRCENILAEQAYSPWGILSCFCFRLSVFRKTIESMLPLIICFHRCLSTTYAQVLKHTRRSENVHAASPMIWSRDNSGTLARIAIGLIMIYLGCTSMFAPLGQDLHDRSTCIQCMYVFYSNLFISSVACCVNSFGSRTIVSDLSYCFKC